MKKLIGLLIALLFISCTQDKISSNTTISNEAVKSKQYFWGTWVDMSTGDEYVITENKCNDYNIVACLTETLTVSELGTFVKQSDGIMIKNKIPFYRKGGTNLTYKVRVVGFSDSRAGGIYGQKNKRVVGKSQSYPSYQETEETDENGIAVLIAPTVNDIQIITVDNNNGETITVDGLRIENNGSNVGTIALVNKNEYSLKVTGIIEEKYKGDGYLYSNCDYPMTLTVTNISDVTAESSIITIVAENDSISLFSMDGFDLNGWVIPNLEAGEKTTINLNIHCNSITTPYIDTGIKVVIDNKSIDKTWDDYVPIRFHKGLDNFTIAAHSVETSADSMLKGFIIYPDGNSQYFSVYNQENKTISVPSFGENESFLLSFCGATASSFMGDSTEMFYSVVRGVTPLNINTFNSKDLVLYGEDNGGNDTQDTAFVTTDSFQAYLHAGDIDYYKIQASNNSDNNIGKFVPITWINKYGDINESVETTAVYGELIDEDTIPKVSPRVGYKFNGYEKYYRYTDSEGHCLRNISTTEPLTLYASWTPIKYTIEYNMNMGGANIGSQTMTYDVSADLRQSSFFARQGYTFLGFSTDSSATEAEYQAGETVCNLTDVDGVVITLYAVWKIHTYTVHFDPNGGNGEQMIDQVITFDPDVTLYSCSYNRDGYSFVGWSKSKNAVLAEYTNQQNVSDVANVDGEYITLYAVWGIEYMIQFDANGGECTMPNQLMLSGKYTTLMANTFSRDGFAFIGWSTDASATIPTYTDEQSVANLSVATNDIVTLYAIWKAKYYISFNANGGEGDMPIQTMISDVNATLNENAFSRSGYIFLGWNTDPNAISAIYTDCQCVVNLSTTLGDTVILYAVWKGEYINNDGNIVLYGNVNLYTSFVDVIDADVIVIGSDENWNGYCTDDSEDDYKGVFIAGRKVKLSPYSIGKYEVTQQLYETVMKSTINYVKGKGSTYPAYCVSWYDAIAFCNKLSILLNKSPCYTVTGIDNWKTLPYSSIPTMSNSNWDAVTVDMYSDGYRLPTEAEWEFAARGGNTNAAYWKYAFSGANSSDLLYHSRLYSYDSNRNYYQVSYTPVDNVYLKLDPKLMTVGHSYFDGAYPYEMYYKGISNGVNSVGSKKANIIGLYDMSGNVAEWCWDWYNSSVTSNDSAYILDGVVADPLGTVSGSYRCSHGGSWGSYAYACAVSSRGSQNPSYRGYNIGFRLVQSVRK